MYENNYLHLAGGYLGYYLSKKILKILNMEWLSQFLKLKIWNTNLKYYPVNQLVYVIKKEP